MKINIPSSLHITLGDFINYKNAPDDVSKMIVITKWNREKILQLKPETIAKTIELYEIELSSGAHDFPRKFKVADRVYGFVPNLEALTTGEFIDLDSYQVKLNANDFSELDKMFCVLFRPIKMEFGQFYNLKRYKLDKIDRYINDIRTMPMLYVNGVRAFFLLTEQQLLKSFPQYLTQQLKTKQTQIESLLSGKVSGGII